MKRTLFPGLILALGLGATPLAAQDANDVDQLRQQLGEMQRAFEETVRQQREQIESLRNRIADLEADEPATTPAPPPAAERPTTALRPNSPFRLGNERNYLDLALNGLFAVGGSTADDIEGGTQLGGHDPNQNGFSVQNVELTLSGAVDPYLTGQANVLLLLDSEGETVLELEEAYLQSTALPANLQLRAGQYLTGFGRLNATHPHSWHFVDQPLVNGRFLGADGLRNPGAQLSWLAPTPFFSELFLGVQNSGGATAASFRGDAHAHGHDEEDEEEFPAFYRHADNDRGVDGPADMLFAPRYETAFDIGDSQVLLIGASAAIGPNHVGGEDAGDTFTQIYGADVTWKWTSPTQVAGFPFVLWQTEAMLRRTEVGGFDWDEDGDGAISDGEVVDDATGLPAVLGSETVNDYGLYSQIVYGFRKGWTAGLRYDWLGGERANYERRALSLDGEALGRDLSRRTRWRVSPNLTWYPSEFSKVRLQYNYDDRRNVGEDHSIWLQFEFTLGAHAAHQF